MKSLFLRIFLWFWLTLILVGTAFVISSPFLTRTRPHLARWERGMGARVLVQVDRVAEALEHHGISKLDPHFDRHHFRGGGGGPPANILIFDEGGREVRGNRTDHDAVELASKAREQGEAIGERRGGRHLIARPVKDLDGRLLVVVGESRGRPDPVDLLEPAVLLPRLLLLALIAGALVWWLARYLSAPVAPLRKATGALASGDLGVRVGRKVFERNDEFGHLARDFNDMAEKVENLIENQRRLMGDVSHELRSPLARLNVALELARQKAPSGAEKELDRIELESSRLDELISRLLEFARLEHGSVGRSPIDLAGLVEEVVADVAFENVEAEIRFERMRSGQITVLGDAGLLRSAVGNIIRNAVFFNRADSSIEVEVEREGGSVVVRVIDCGPGVPEEELTKIFGVFYRIEDARDRSRGGAGLGLAIAARAAERHGGTISAANRVGGGLIVELSLPVADD